MPQSMAKLIIKGNGMYTIQNTSALRDIVSALHQ